jgi:hypothetical protein
MTLARSLPDSPGEWFLFLAALAVYIAARFVLAWRQARKDGAEHPLRTAFDDDEPDNGSRSVMLGGYASYKEFLGVVASGIAIGIVAAATDGPLRVALMATIIPIIVVAMAYFDFRRARRNRQRDGGLHPGGDLTSRSLDRP